MRSTSVALGKAVRRLAERGGSAFVAHQNLRLHAADAGEGRELLKQVAEQVAAALRQDFIHRLKGHVLVQVLLLAGIADASHLRTADDAQQVEFVKRAGGFGECEAQPLAKYAFRAGSSRRSEEVRTARPRRAGALAW